MTSDCSGTVLERPAREGESPVGETERSRATVILLMIGVAYYITRQRLRLQRERTDHYLLLAEEAN